MKRLHGLAGAALYRLQCLPLYRLIGRHIAPGMTLREVYEDNLRAIDLYRKLGFEMYTNPDLETRLEPERAASGRRRVAMRKRLSDHDTPTNT